MKNLILVFLILILVIMMPVDNTYALETGPFLPDWYDFTLIPVNSININEVAQLKMILEAKDFDIPLVSVELLVQDGLKKPKQDYKCYKDFILGKNETREVVLPVKGVKKGDYYATVRLTLTPPIEELRKNIEKRDIDEDEKEKLLTLLNELKEDEKTVLSRSVTVNVKE